MRLAGRKVATLLGTGWVGGGGGEEREKSREVCGIVVFLDGARNILILLCRSFQKSRKSSLFLSLRRKVGENKNH